MGIRVKPRSNEPIEKAFRRLKKLLDKEGLSRDLVRHRYYESKGTRRRRDRLRSVRKLRRQR